MAKRILMTIRSANARYVIETAHNAGYELIIANNAPNDEGLKPLADEAYTVDASDTEAMVKFIKDKKIDGMFVTASDAHLRFYCDICEKAGIFAYCTKEQATAISDKIEFKKNCKKFGLNVIPEYRVENEEDIKKAEIKYPVMVKAPDNSGGSLGMTLVYKEENLMDAIEFAKKYSPSKTVIIEHFIDGDEFVINYMFVNKNPYVLYTKDYCKDMENGNVHRDNAMISPSKYENLFYEKAHEKLIQMFKAIGMQNGIVFLQCFVEDNELYFFEGGCRAGGADEYYLWKNIYGVDFIEAMLNFSLYGDYKIKNLEEILSTKKQSKKESVLNVLVGEGKITSISGIKEIRELPGVTKATVLREVNDVVKGDYTSGQIALRVMIEADNGEDYLSKVDKIYSLLKFSDENGNNMVIPHINLKHWL